MPVFFVRKASEYAASNKLQKAILSKMPPYYNQLLDDPQALIKRLETMVGFLNQSFRRCTPMKVEANPTGSYRGGYTAKADNQEEQRMELGKQKGWTISISGLLELNLMPVIGTLDFSEKDESLRRPQPSQPVISQGSSQLSVFA